MGRAFCAGGRARRMWEDSVLPDAVGRGLSAAFPGWAGSPRSVHRHRSCLHC